MAIPNQINGTELSREEFQDNLLPRYVILPLNLTIDSDGCGKKFLVPRNLSCSKGGLVLVQHNNAAKEWSDLSA